ncbi:amidohydrolase family protein [Arthrobacter sp. KBS0702]|nr:amidohydrolase family protein [Arthrobacter sp. KBS0702]
MLLDVHTHAMNSCHWGHEWDDHWKPVYGYDWTDVTPAAYDAAMSEGGVDVSFVFGVTARYAGMSTPNEFIADFVARCQSNVVGFMALDPTDPGALEQMQDGVQRGLRGIKCYPVLGLYDARDERFDPFYSAAADAGLVLLWHMGATPSPIGKLELSNPLVVDEVARRHPDLVQIIAHLGHPWQRETMAVLRKNRRVFSDVSAVWARPADGYRALVRAQEWGVVDKLLFGSDFPLWTPAQAQDGLKAVAAARVQGMPAISNELLDHVLHGDHLEMLGLTR